MVLLVQAAGLCWAVPVAARIHEGVVWTARDRRTLLDKLSGLLLGLQWSGPLTVVADAYYAAAKFARALLTNGHHLVTRVRSNAVAYLPRPDPVAANDGDDALSTAPKPGCAIGSVTASSFSKPPAQSMGNRVLACAITATTCSGAPWVSWCALSGSFTRRAGL